jgi:hypothetical protein
MKTNFSLHISIWFAMLILVWVDDAHAYLDPGTGSMLFQSLIAAIAGGVFVIKTYWSEFRKKFLSKKASTPKRSESDSDSP